MTLIALLFFSFCSHYRPSVMEHAARVNHQPATGCLVAAMHEPLGTMLFVHSYTTGNSAVCRVVDQVAARDYARHKAQGISIEIGFKEIGKLCNLSYYGQEPARMCKVSYTRISTARAATRRTAWRTR